jgi:hypothetical protein
MVLLAAPHQAALAGMVGTETALEVIGSDGARTYLKSLLNRDDVQAVIVAQGVDPLEAKARLDSLSDAEVTALAREIKQLPAGAGGGWVGWLLVGIFAVILLVMGGFINP